MYPPPNHSRGKPRPGATRRRARVHLALGLVLGLTSLCWVAAATAAGHPERLEISPGMKLPASAAVESLPLIQMHSGRFLGLGQPAANLAASSVGAARHVILQFASSPNATQRLTLAAFGIQLLDYLPDHAFFAMVPRPLTAADWQSAGVIWAGPIYPEDKLSPRLLEGKLGTWAKTPDGQALLQLRTFADVPMKEASHDLSVAGVTVLSQLPVAHEFNVRLPATQIRALAGLDDVRWVQEIPPPAVSFVDGSRTNMQANLVEAAPYNLNGDGVTVGIWDVGIPDATHADFAGRIVVVDTNAPAGVTDHATHVAGIVAGSGSLSEQFGGYHDQWHGMAPDADLVCWDTINEIAEHQAAITQHHVVVSQNSWGVAVNTVIANCSLYGDYTADCAGYDGIVSGTLFGGRVSVVFAAGNARQQVSYSCPDGPYSVLTPPGTAKDVITVGAIYSDTSGMTPFSSWGPTDDGRLKPDVMASGDELGNDHGITSTFPGNTYGVLIGTSMAAPAVSGAAALLVEDYRQLFNGEDPLPSTVKCLLIHTAVNLPGTPPGPSYSAGYGRVQIKDAVDQLNAGGVIVGEVDNHQTNTYELSVPAGTPTVKVTLVWDDPPATENAAIALVNDLDLVVLDPNGQRHYPWTLDPANPSAPAQQNREDHLNVVEQVETTGTVPAGNWTVEVVGHNVPVGPEQLYSLSFTPTNITAPPILQMSQDAFDDRPEGNGNGRLDPGETIYETVTLRNSDGPTAKTVTSHLVAESPGVTVLQGDAAYGDLAPGQSATNSTPLIYRLAKTVPCGSTVVLRDETAINGVPLYTNYISHVLGSLSITNTTTNVFDRVEPPLVIPDPGTIASTLTVPVTGKVDSVTVGVRLAHPWLGDLKLELQHPDGTRVLLVAGDSLYGTNGLGTGTCDDPSLAPTVFDDNASAPITSGSGSFVGTFQPAGHLSDLVGKALQGNWKLVVTDTTAGDQGAILCWRLKASYTQTGYVCSVFNRPPVADPRTASVFYGLPRTLQLTGHDPDGDPITFSLVGQPNHGTLSGLDATNGTVIYTPTAGYIGADSFSFQVNDGLTNSAPAAVTLNVSAPLADLALSITGPRQLALGQSYTNVAVVTNAGPNTASIVLLTGRIDPRVSLLAAQTAAGTTNLSGSIFGLDLGTLPAGASSKVSLVLRANTLGFVTNVFSDSAVEADPVPENNSTNVISEINALADLGVSQTLTPTPPLLGQPAQLLLVVTNQGPQDATQVQLTDDLPANMTVSGVTQTQGTNALTSGRLTCDLGNLPVGAGATLHIGLVPSALGDWTNIAQVAGAQFDFTTNNNQSTLTAQTMPAADLVVSQAVSRSPLPVGYPVVYTVAVTNLGPSTASAVQLLDLISTNADFLPIQPTPTGWYLTNGLLTVQVGNLPPGTGASLQFGAQAQSVGTVTNTVSVNAVEADPRTTNNTSALTTPAVATVDLALTMTPSASPTALDHPLTYTLAVTNLSQEPATGVVVTNPLPAGTTFVSANPDQGTASVQAGGVVAQLGDLAAGAGTALQLTLTPSAVGQLTNTARVTANELQISLTHSTATAVVSVEPATDLALSVQTDPAVVAPSNQVTFTLTVTNSGTNDATHVVVTGTLPDGVSSPGGATIDQQLGTLAGGAQTSFTLTATGVTTGGWQGTATVTADQLDLNPTNNTAAINVTVRGHAELSLLTTTPQVSAYYHDTVPLEFVVTNAGPDTALDVRGTNQLPAALSFVSASASQGTATNMAGSVRFDLGPLGAQKTAHFTVVTRATALGTATNQAAVASEAIDTNAADNSVTNVVTIQAAADMAVLATQPAAPTPLAQPFTVSWVVTNKGPSEAHNVTFGGTIPDGLGLLGVTVGQGTVTTNAQSFQVQWASLAAGAAVSPRLQLTSTTPGDFTLQATADAQETDRNTSNNVGTVRLTVLPVSDLQVSNQLLTLPPFYAGQPVVFKLHVANVGPNAAPAVMLTNQLSPGSDFLAVQTSQGTVTTNAAGALVVALGNLGVNQSTDIQLAVLPLTDGSFTNQAVVSARAVETNPSDNSATLVLPIEPAADLAVRAHSSLPTAILGQPFTVTFTITNQGPSTATGAFLDVAFTGATNGFSLTNSVGSVGVNSNSVHWAVGDLASGAAQALAMTFTPTDPSGLSFTGSVGGNEYDANPTNNAISFTVNAKPATDLALSLTPAEALLPLDSPWVLTLSVTNLGPNPATGVVVTNTLPVGATLIATNVSQGAAWHIGPNLVGNLGDLAVNAGATITLTLQPTGIGGLTNTATVASGLADPDLANNTATATATAYPEAELSLTAANEPATATEGALVTWTLTVTNAGPQSAQDLQVATTLPAGLDYDSADPGAGQVTAQGGDVAFNLDALAAGTSAVFTLRARANVPGTYTNHFALTAEAYQTDTNDDTAITVTTVAPTADLALREIPPPTVPLAGSDFTWSFVVTNLGPATATEVVVTNLLSDSLQYLDSNVSQGTNSVAGGLLTWEVGDLPANAAATLQLRFHAPSAGPVTNRLGVVAAVIDPVSTNNSLTATLTLPIAADLQVTVVPAARLVPPATSVVCTVTLTNAGPDAATGITVTNVLPANVTLGSVTVTTGNVSSGNAPLLWSLDQLPPHSAAQLQANLQPSGTGDYTYYASAGAHEPDPNRTNNVTIGTFSVLPQADLGLTLSIPPLPIAVGQPQTYILTVFNNGPEDAPNVRIVDSLPPDSTNIVAKVTQGTWSALGTHLTGALGTVAVHAQAAMTVQYSATTVGPVAHVATVLGDVADLLPGNNNVLVTNLVYPLATLRVTQSAPSAVYVGQNLTFTIHVDNTSTNPAPNTLLLAAFSLNVDIASASASAGTATVKPPGVICNLGKLAPGADAVVTIVLSAQQTGNIICQATANSPAADPNDPQITSRLVVPAYSQPTLQFQQSGLFLTLSWPTAASDFVLQSADSLNNPVWELVKNPVETVGDNLEVVIKLTADQRYYRLYKP